MPYPIDHKTRLDCIYRYYLNNDVKFKIIKYLYNRELALLTPSWVKYPFMKKKSIRNLRVHNTQFLDSTLTVTRLLCPGYRTFINFYYSLAVFGDGIPFKDLKIFTRDTKLWNKKANARIISYDFLLDIDAGSHEDWDFCKYSAEIIKKVYDALKVPYSLRFSGKGWHFVTPYKYLPQYYSMNPLDRNNIYSFLLKIARFFYNHHSQMVDLKIYDSRRVIKIPYTLAIYEDEDYICTPMASHKMFEEFKLDDYRAGNILINIREAPVDYIFNSTGNFMNLVKFIEKIEGDKYFENG